MSEKKTNKPEKENGLKSVQKQLGTKPGQSVENAEDPASKITREGEPHLGREERKVYQKALIALNGSGIVYAVGATFARNAYTHVWRKTKDLDIFLKPEDLRTAMDILNDAGFDTEVMARHWLAKAHFGEYTVDLIFGNAHGYHVINDQSFEGSQEAEVLGVKTSLIPVEEMIASIAYVAERRRFDGGEVAHLILCSEGKLDWQRIVDRLGEDSELLLWHLILFDFIYPGHSNYLPQELMVQLFDQARKRWRKRSKNPKEFRGTLIDPFLFAVDIDDWGYEDPRNMEPLVNKKGAPL
jgi:hypothetical protein